MGPGVSRPAARLILGLLAAVQAVDGLYALLAPRSFYEDFPAGRGWVEALPAYNEHLVRDVGSLFLATAVFLALAAYHLERRLVIAASASILVFAVPHFLFHVLNLEPFPAGDAIGETIVLAAMVIAPAWLLFAVLRSPPAPPGSRDAA
jgi:hypothetical protein